MRWKTRQHFLTTSTPKKRKQQTFKSSRRQKGDRFIDIHVCYNFLFMQCFIIHWASLASACSSWGKISAAAFLCCSLKNVKIFYFTQLETLTCSCSTATYVVIFVIKLDPHSFAVASRHSAAAAPAQGDRDDSVDVSQHDGNTDTYATQCKKKHFITVSTYKLFWCISVKLQISLLYSTRLIILTHHRNTIKYLTCCQETDGERERQTREKR